MKKLNLLALLLALGAIFCWAIPTFAYNVYTYTGNEFTNFDRVVHGANPPALPYGEPTNLTLNITLPDTVSLIQYAHDYYLYPHAVVASDGSGYTGTLILIGYDSINHTHITFDGLTPEGLPTIWYIYMVQSVQDYSHEPSASWVEGITSNQTEDTALQGMTNYYDNPWRYEQRIVLASNHNPGTWSMEHFPDPPQPVPLPSALLLLSSGLFGLTGWRRFRKG